jgi:uracil-DNA glycosylase
MPDFNKPLPELHREWQGCTRCVLGAKREDSGGRMAPGEGRSGGIMWIGEGPGRLESETGRPFVGPSGDVLRRSINKLGLAECSYISNVVICRSFGPKMDNAGQPVTRWDRRSGTRLPVLEDEPPPALAINACLSRLYEEIYLVDPLLIVALGGEAAKALQRRSMKVTEKRGTTSQINVPGVWSLPDLTNKGAWARRHKGVTSYPTTQNYVGYLMFVTLHPSHVLRERANRSFGNPTQVFIEDMHFINDIYFRLLKEGFGMDCVRRTQILPNDIIED